MTPPNPYETGLDRNPANHAIARSTTSAEFRELIRRAPDYVPSYLMLGQALETAAKADKLGLPEYYAMEAYRVV